MSGLKIGICGGGIGGLCAALALRQMGHEVEVFEKASQFGRIGADINLTPNAVFALDGLGVGEALRKTAARPTHRISRDGISGEETSRLPMSDAAEEKYGAPQLTIHRADVLSALQAQIPKEIFHFGMSVKDVELDDTSATINFTQDESRRFDLVLGADGIHSAIRTALFGQDDPHFTGLVSYRSVFPRARGATLDNLDTFTKWWGETTDKQIVTFPLTGGKEIFVFATTPQSDWKEEGWTLPGDVQELRDEYQDFHPDARALLNACETVTKSALFVREPMDSWSKGAATLIGDAAQGACMAIEDSVVLGRCLKHANPASLRDDLEKYETARKPRTAEIQRSSLANDWLKGKSNADWVYGYNAWNVPIGEDA